MPTIPSRRNHLQARAISLLYASRLEYVRVGSSSPLSSRELRHDHRPENIRTAYCVVVFGLFTQANTRLFPLRYLLIYSIASSICDVSSLPQLNTNRRRAKVCTGIVDDDTCSPLPWFSFAKHRQGASMSARIGYRDTIIGKQSSPYSCVTSVRLT